jgi:hypothetical protein
MDTITRRVQPRNWSRVVAIGDGHRWLFNIVPGSVKVDGVLGSVSFDAKFTKLNQIRHFTIALDAITGIEEA